ncbi:acyltransferase [uncultured Lamprocystis sp.]|jgi:peptidoglycan/LPS O-acetylase OafA/YrhL|uniref:acyltransferase family protein n=1 Tax=uncultured Lamprocystis sp. TaxID=543132 RepID=UPI0025FB606E|nr:acyltransferase [uncultured Lamprocystis sp.]
MSYAVFKSTRNFGSLDGLRAVSILAVIWHHSARHFFPGVTIAGHGNLGVNLFFVISGFLITTLLLREQERTGTISIRKFMMRRALRIFPLYYTVLLLYLVLVLIAERGTAPGTAFMHNFFFFATYTSNWFVPLLDARVIFYFSWSLAVEEQFYLVWPWIEKLLGRLFSPLLLIAALIVGLAEADINFFACILLGVALAHLLNHPLHFQWTQALLAPPPMVLIYLVLTLVALMIPGMPIYIIYLALTLLLGACVVREDHLLAPVLRFRPLVLIGRISYGLYLLHMLAYNLVKRGLGQWIGDQPWMLFGMTTLVGTAMAWVSFHYYESYFLRLKARFAT